MRLTVDPEALQFDPLSVEYSTPVTAEPPLLP